MLDIFTRYRINGKNWDKAFYTFYFVLSSFSYGFLFTFFPNILVDMKFILDSTITLVSLYTTAETVGYILGTFVGLTYKYLNRQLVLGVAYSVLTIACSMIPMVPNLYLLYTCGFIFGFGSSTYVAGVVVWAMDLWQQRAGSVLQAMDFCFAAGSIVCTVILRPFLVGELNHENENFTETFAVNDHDNIDRRARIMWPVLIIGICILPVPISSLIMYFIKPYKPPEIKIKHLNEEIKVEEMKLFDRPETPRKVMRILFALWYAFYCIFETIFLKFAVTYYQYSPLRLSAQKSAEVFSIAVAVYTAFRGLNVFIGLKVKIFYMLSIHYIILVIGMILLLFGQNNETLLLIASITLCWGFSAMFAGIYNFTGRQLTMTNQLNTVFTLIRGLFTLFTPYIIGLYIVDYSLIFILIKLFYLISSLILFILINILIRKYSKLLNTKLKTKF